MTLHACFAARPYINFLSFKFREVHPDHSGFERKATKFMLLKTPKTILEMCLRFVINVLITFLSGSKIQPKKQRAKTKKSLKHYDKLKKNR